MSTNTDTTTLEDQEAIDISEFDIRNCSEDDVKFIEEIINLANEKLPKKFKKTKFPLIDITDDPDFTSLRDQVNYKSDDAHSVFSVGDANGDFDTEDVKLKLSKTLGSPFVIEGSVKSDGVAVCLVKHSLPRSKVLEKFAISEKKDKKETMSYGEYKAAYSTGTSSLARAQMEAILSRTGAAAIPAAAFGTAPITGF